MVDRRYLDSVENGIVDNGRRVLRGVGIEVFVKDVVWILYDFFRVMGIGSGFY